MNKDAAVAWWSAIRSNIAVDNLVRGYVLAKKGWAGPETYLKGQSWVEDLDYEVEFLRELAAGLEEHARAVREDLEREQRESE